MSGTSVRAAAYAPTRSPAAVQGGPGRTLTRLFDWLLLWQERAAQRRRLGELDDRMLRDIGLDRADITHEITKPFWRG